MSESTSHSADTVSERESNVYYIMRCGSMLAWTAACSDPQRFAVRRRRLHLANPQWGSRGVVMPEELCHTGAYKQG